MASWHIAAVGTDGHCVTLDRGVSKERAAELKEMLVSCDVFWEVRIEPDLPEELWTDEACPPLPEMD